jgi:hypothetical protein
MLLVWGGLQPRDVIKNAKPKCKRKKRRKKNEQLDSSRKLPQG